MEKKEMIPEFLTQEGKEKERRRKNRIILSIVITLILAVSAISVYYLKLKPAYKDAVLQYDTAVVGYDKATEEFTDKCTQIESKNRELNRVIEELQGIVDSGEKPYDEESIPNANSEINEGKIALIKLPEFERLELQNSSDYNVFQTKLIHMKISNIKTTTEELINITEELQVPDYSDEIAGIDEAKNLLERSIRQMKQVTCPEETFVLQRMTNIRNEIGIVDMIALTEDSDPGNYIGKGGWYTAKIIFKHKDVEHYGLDNGLLTLNEVGNPAGGCVEVYRTEEDAKRRADELKSQEGTVRSPGARKICGTVLIRVSDNLKVSYQQELLDRIEAELIRLEE